MESFNIKVKNLFKFGKSTTNEQIFKTNKNAFVIPAYQREFQWDEQKINSLLEDIAKRDKFLGIIILDEKDDCYEVIDGQQRLTSIVLILMSLYNNYVNSTLEQSSIYQFLFNDTKYILKNDSIGAYLEKKIDHMKNMIELNIKEENDIYYQKQIFTESYDLINGFITKLVLEKKVSDFKQKLLECEFLILIQEEAIRTSPVQQVFLDINEKSKLLEHSDIFKGYCFKNFDSEHEEVLKESWVKLKKNSIYFEQNLGYEDLSEYIYNYILSHYNQNIREDLYIKGKHYLENKDMDETNDCLKKMILFGENIITFNNNIDKDSYQFEDLCNKPFQQKAVTKNLKLMAKMILNYGKANYYKFPFMHIIDSFLSDNEYSKKAKQVDIKKIFSNLFIYSFFFIQCASKRKSSIDSSISEAIKNKKTISEIVNQTKELRLKYYDKFCENIFNNLESFDYKKHGIIYSIIDFYDVNNNYLNNLYQTQTSDSNQEHNHEHFIIPNDYKLGIQFILDDGKELLLKSKDVFINSNIEKFKNSIENSLILPEKLNEKVERFDIITKIKIIKEDYKNKLPNHIKTIIGYIENMESYKTLQQIEKTESVQDEIIKNYINFINDYFSEKNIVSIKEAITQTFKKSFQNN